MANLNKIIAVLFLLFFVISCRNTQIIPPKKLSNIPETAIWYGGADGGCWITIQKTKKINQFFIKCYFDTTGDLWEQAIFELDTLCTGRNLTTEELYNKIDGFNGEFIVIKDYMKNGKNCILEKVNKKK